MLQREGDGGARHGEPLQHVGSGEIFGARGFQEFEPGGHSAEEARCLHPRAACAGRRLDCARFAVIDRDAPRLRRALHPADDRQARDSADRRQRFAAKAERADIDKIVIGKLRGGVAFERQREVGAGNAGAVIVHGNPGRAAGAQTAVDAPRACVYCILDQFLDRRRRALDHLARRDAVDHRVRQAAQHHRWPMAPR